MLTCGHDREPFGEPMCEHLRVCREPWLSYVRWYTGCRMAADLLCNSCVLEREQGRTVPADVVCQECFEYATTTIGRLEGVRGKPEILVRSEPINCDFQRTNLPEDVGKIVDIAPILVDSSSTWLLLAEDGLISRFDANTGVWNRLASTSLDSEPDHDPWCDHILTRRMYCSPNGDFAAIVNDYGRYGQIIDLRTGNVTLALDGGDDNYSETVPFSFAFAKVAGRVVAVHRTDWNRLDVSDPSNGSLLTARGPTSYTHSEERPAHYLDYFHGSLRISPDGGRIVDDGWVWHPLGAVTTWSIEPWVSTNVWESEDGPTLKGLCVRGYYWDHALTWLDENRIAVGGLGDDDNEMIDGVRIFDLSLGSVDGVFWTSDCCERIAFAGPAGVFFSDGKYLFSADQNGLSRWDVSDGSRTGFLDGFKPTHHHTGAGELVELVDNRLVRCRIDNGVR